MKIITAIIKSAVFLTLLPSIIYSESLVTKEDSSSEVDASIIDSYNSHRKVGIHKSPLVGTVDKGILLKKLKKNRKGKRSKHKVELTNLSGRTVKIKNLHNHEVILTDIASGCSTHKFLAQKKGSKKIIDYQARCCVKSNDTTQCMIHEGTTNVEPNPSRSWVQAFCTPTVVNCSLVVNSCNPYDQGACPNVDENCTLTEKTPQCQPPNSFACGLEGGTSVSCSHDDDCTGSDGKANKTVCGENMKCFNECGPVY